MGAFVIVCSPFQWPRTAQENANKDSVVAQGEGVNPVALGLWNMLIARVRSRQADHQPKN